MKAAATAIRLRIKNTMPGRFYYVAIGVIEISSREVSVAGLRSGDEIGNTITVSPGSLDIFCAEWLKLRGLIEDI